MPSAPARAAFLRLVDKTKPEPDRIPGLGPSISELKVLASSIMFFEADVLQSKPEQNPIASANTALQRLHAITAYHEHLVEQQNVRDSGEFETCEYSDDEVLASMKSLPLATAKEIYLDLHFISNSSPSEELRAAADQICCVVYAGWNNPVSPSGQVFSKP